MSVYNTLFAVSIFGAAACVVAFWFGLMPLKKANGSSFVLQFILGTAVIEFIWAGMMAYNAIFSRDLLPTGGMALTISIFARMKPTLIAVGLIYMGIRIRRGLKEEGH